MKRLLDWLFKAEDAGRILTIVAMTAVVFYQVESETYRRDRDLEAARFIMIWSIFIGAVVTTREDSHIRMGGFFKSERGRTTFEWCSKVVTFVFLCIFVKWSYDFALHSWQKKMNSIVLDVPLIVVHICFLVTGVLMAFHALVHLMTSTRRVLGFGKGDDR